MSKKADAAKAKQKKQKIIAAAGGVILLALLAFQAPKVMKQLNKKPPPPPAIASPTSATPGGTPSLAAPTLSGNEQAPSTTTASNGSSLASGDVAPAVEQGQLASFSRFASKDPFAQQMSTDATATTPSSGGGRTPLTGASPPPSGGSSSSGGGTASLPPSGGGTTVEPVPGSAVISLNGTLMSVTTGTDFPQPSTSDPSAQPLFHLLALTAHTAKITIAGGSYSNGAKAVTLRENKPLTLMNTADGTKYRLILKPQGTAVPPDGSGSTGTTTVALPPATP